MTERTLGREQAIYRVTWIGFAVNLVLSAGKLAAGIWGHSAAMVADAIHSVSDFATDLVVLLFVRVSAKPRDDDHDYGHGKYETLATLIIGAALAGVGIKLLWSGGTAIRDFTRGLLPTQPGVVALWAAVVSIVAKEALYRYTARVGRRVNSPSVVANAWHHRSDALSSVGTLVGIGCAYFLGGGWRLADPAAAIVVALLILRVAWQLMKMGMDELLEKSLPREQEEHILTLIAADPAVASPHNLRTRRIGQNIAVEVHIRVDGAMTVTESHRLTVDIERRLRDAYGEGTIVSIHVEPRKQPPVNKLSGSAFGFPNVRKIEREYVFSRYFPARMSRFSISPRQNARRDFLRPDSCVRTVTVGKAVAVCELLKNLEICKKVIILPP